MRKVTAAVIIEDGRLFVTRRPPDDPLAGKWELPGGKIEPGETAEECLQRELLEELEMRADIGALVATTVYHYPHGSFEMLAFEATRASDYLLLVHDNAAWVGRDDLDSIELAPADVELVSEIIESGFWKTRP